MRSKTGACSSSSGESEIPFYKHLAPNGAMVCISLCPLWLIVLPALFKPRQQTFNMISFRVRQLLFPKPDSIVRVRNVSRFVHAGGGGELQRRLVQLAL